ncbi:MAG: hypothetical protein ACK514_10980 [Bacteroidota bacterium]|jgi:hypothetical protein|nr:hypothetical protein [Cytophagales bacterium]MCE2956789.1 hypothetical protein [Flammeovirgaceae bacterium]MCZ8069154.1 hypothetical protein [Cytophagales bacterium]
MKTMFVCLFVLCFASVTSSFAQRAMVKNDTAYYDNQKFYKGQRISLTYGSSADKSFAFMFFGNGFSGLSKVAPTAAKLDAVVDKVMMRGKVKCYLRAKLDGGAMLGNRLIIDLEGAWDNKEFKIAEESKN